MPPPSWELLQDFQYLLIYIIRLKELALEIVSRSLRIEKCLQESIVVMCNRSDTYSVLVITHPWLHIGKKHPETAGAPYIIMSYS